MFVPFLIMLREGLEAALIVSLIASYLKRTQRGRWIGVMWIGVFLAAALCLGLGILINETTGGVSDYHTALVYLLETTGEVTVRETEKMSGSWASPQELSAVFDRLETWSQIVLEEVISPNAV